MNKIAVATFVAATFMVNSFAWALSDVTDRIRSIDTGTHEVRLRNGQYYIIPTDISLNSFKVGDVVTVTVHQYHDGLNYAETMTKKN